MITETSHLKLLIAFYEEEKIQLQKLIDEYLAESDYKMAHKNSKAMYRLNDRLQTLNNIEDRLYDEKAYRQGKIDGLEKRIETESSRYMKARFEKDLQWAKEELEKLIQNSQAKFTGNETLLDETLINLVEGKIKNLKLILKKADNLFLGFSYSRKLLKVTLPNVKQHTKNRILVNDKINSFKKSGFVLAENETKLVLTLAGNKEDVIKRLKIILSKIVFEIFYFKEFNNQSYIQFTEKTSR